MAAEATPAGAREAAEIVLASIVRERAGIRVPQLEQPIGDRVDDELVVTVRLLGAFATGANPRTLGIVRFAKKVRLVLGKEVELALDELAEAVAAERQISSA